MFAVEPGRLFNPIEFDGIKTRILQLLPDTKKSKWRSELGRGGIRVENRAILPVISLLRPGTGALRRLIISLHGTNLIAPSHAKAGGALRWPPQSKFVPPVTPL